MLSSKVALMLHISSPARKNFAPFAPFAPFAAKNLCVLRDYIDKLSVLIYHPRSTGR